MKQYKTLATVSVGGGKVRLSSAQAKDRMHNLQPLGDEEYQVLSPVQFKKGEVIGLEVEDKATLAKLEEVSAQAVQELSSAQPAAEASSKPKAKKGLFGLGS